MTVDRDRLREAIHNIEQSSQAWCDGDFDRHHELLKDHPYDTAKEAARAVVDAPEVWWCNYYENGTADRRLCLPPAHKDCGWVALVPVQKGIESNP